MLSAWNDKSALFVMGYGGKQRWIKHSPTLNPTYLAIHNTEIEVKMGAERVEVTLSPSKDKTGNITNI